LVVGCAPRPGCESEWRGLVDGCLEGTFSEAERGRFFEVGRPAGEALGAPRVGVDLATNAWLLETRKPQGPAEADALLKEFSGYHVASLVECDGVPRYSHGGLYEGVDATSFRGSFLEACSDVLAKSAIGLAWDSKLPEAAAAYERFA
jgi:hypothetical protein